jgi:anaerobic magnesium-protoporphyrin IX monomethyl ester cyclase
MATTRRVVLVQPRSTGGNFEYVAIPRQGMLFLSRALENWSKRDGAPYRYEREIWFEDRSGKIDPDKDLDGADILLVTALINETPRAYEIAKKAKLYHPNIVVIGGGPQMGPLPEEAMRVTGMDVVVQREGEDVIGPLCDLLMAFQGEDRTRELHKLGGIAFMDGGKVVQRPFRRMIPSDYVELPDYESIRDLTPQNPMAAGVLETSRGCTESCTYCEVIEQFVGYRMVQPETELKRLMQLQRMATDGLIYQWPDGNVRVFVSDDLHSPPKRAIKFRNDRLQRARGWKSLTEGMRFITQNRAELGSDPELAEAFREAGIEMLYIGVESSSAENLKAIHKRQEPDQMHKDLVALKEWGFRVVAMTIIGLPFDTEESIMQLAEWVTGVSHYQTANLLTPLPATINWPDGHGGGLPLLDRDGTLLPEGKLPPYDLFTGRQFVHYDRRWTMQESRELYKRYTDRLKPIDRLYETIFRRMERKSQRGGGAIPVRV